MPLNCMLKMVKMKNFYVYVYLIVTKIPPPHVSKLKARNEKLQVPKLRTDLGAGSRFWMQIPYKGSESRYYLICVVNSGFNIRYTLKSPGELTKVLIPGPHARILWLNLFRTSLRCLQNQGLGTLMETNPLWIWVHSQNYELHEERRKCQ